MTPYYEKDGVTLYLGDARDVLPTIERAHLIVTDPPYMFGMASTAKETKAGSWADMMNAASWYAGILRECRRITEPDQGAAWVFNSWRSFPVLARAAFEASWPIESLMVWDREWIGPGGPAGLRPSYEIAALFRQPEFGIRNRSLPDIWRSKWAGKKKHHPAEKPVDLLKRMISESGGGLVLDPFAGSGSTLVAAKSLGIPAIGIEMEERYCAKAVERLTNGA